MAPIVVLKPKNLHWGKTPTRRIKLKERNGGGTKSRANTEGFQYVFMLRDCGCAFTMRFWDFVYWRKKSGGEAGFESIPFQRASVSLGEEHAYLTSP